MHLLLSAYLLSVEISTCAHSNMLVWYWKIFVSNNMHVIGMLYTERTIQCHVIDYLSCVKVKFGVRRERVPFVLARDFEIIIDK